MLDPKTEARMKREHYEKYEELAQKFKAYGIECRVPASKERILMAIEAGDEHLNSIPLVIWDRAASIEYRTSVQTPYRPHCPTCGCAPSSPPVPELWRAFFHVTKDGKRAFYSLAERVCLLKHVARYWIAQVPPPPKSEGGLR
jgi:hypothetical protein